MARFFPIRRVIAEAHVLLCLRWPALLAVRVGHALCRKAHRDIDSILLVRPDGLGDCILTLPLIESLRRCFPLAGITVVTTGMAAPLFSALPAVNRVIVLRPALRVGWPKYLRDLLGALRILPQLRGEYFDAAILPRWDADIYQGTLLCALSGAPVRIGYADGTTVYKLRLCRGFQRAWTQVLPPGSLNHEAQRALAAAAALGWETGDPQPHLHLQQAERDAARAWLQASLPRSVGSRILIAVGLPAAEGKKRPSPDLYRNVLRRLGDTVAFVLFADSETAADARTLHGILPSSCIAQQLPLLLAAGVLAECTVFTGADSGLGHLAAAVGCPTITLFAQALTCGDHTGWHSNSPERFRPLHPRGIVLQPEHPRPGCENGCRASGPHCILDIPAECVTDAIRSLLPAPRRACKGAALRGQQVNTIRAWHRSPSLDTRSPA